MLTKRYMASLANIPRIMQRIVEGTAPPKFTVEHLRGIGFKGSNDRAIIPMFKDLGFLSQVGVPTQRYHDYRDASKSKQVLGEALRESYEELFHINARPTEKDKPAIIGKFKSTHNVSDRVSEQQAATFFALLKLADFDKVPAKKPVQVVDESKPSAEPEHKEQELFVPQSIALRYNIEIHLPATKDIEVYNSIFKSLKEHLLD